MDDNGTYLENIYGTYKECITNISINIYDIKYKAPPYIYLSHTHTGAAFGGRPIGSVCV